MKTLLLIACLAASAPVFSQQCGNYLYFQQNKTITMTSAKANGDETGQVVYKVSNVSDSSGYTVATLNSDVFDKKGKSIATAVVRILCNGGALQMDMRMMLPQQPNQKSQSTMDVQAGGSYLQYPGSLNVGDVLPDGHITMQMNTSGMAQTITMDITNRKVEAQESVTTPAGTWTCYRISFSGKIQMKMGAIGMPAMNSETTEWFAPGVGVVKTQSKYGTSQITAIN